eukprot:607609-Pelagomonas_calceolata.AAC.1
MRTYHTHFGIPLGSITGWWDEKKRSKKPLLPPYLRHDIPHKPAADQPDFRAVGQPLVILTLCNKCDWHTVQDEEHIILDCPTQDLTNLRAQFQH